MAYGLQTYQDGARREDQLYRVIHYDKISE